MKRRLAHAFVPLALIGAAVFGAADVAAQNPSADRNASAHAPRRDVPAANARVVDAPTAPEASSRNDDEAAPSANDASVALWQARLARVPGVVVVHAAQPPRCASDVLCMTRLAERERARFVFWTETSKTRDRWVVYDVRTGVRTVNHAPPHVRFRDHALAAMMARALPSAGGEQRVCLIGVYDEGEPSLKDLYRSDIPWTLYGAMLFGAGGGIFALGAITLGGTALVSALGGLGAIPGDANDNATLFALSASMTALLSAGLFLFSAMGVTYWLLEEGPLAAAGPE